MRAKILQTLRILLRTLGILFICYLAFAGGWKDLTFGRVHRLAAETFLPPSIRGGTKVTEARIYLLAGTREQTTTTIFPGGHPIHGGITLTGAELTPFLDLWERQTVTDLYSAGMCHEPPYGFSLYNGSRLVREISICWKCRNFSFKPWPFPAHIAGFDPESDQAKKLLAFCDARLPYYRPPPKAVKNPVPVKPEPAR